MIFGCQSTYFNYQFVSEILDTENCVFYLLGLLMVCFSLFVFELFLNIHGKFLNFWFCHWLVLGVSYLYGSVQYTSVRFSKPTKHREGTCLFREPLASPRLICFGRSSGDHISWQVCCRQLDTVCDERPKSPIEKRKRNLKLFSPISRGEEKFENPFPSFEKRKRNLKKKKILNF